MSSKLKENEKKLQKKDISKEYFYFKEDTQNHDFSDFVKLNSSPRGIILSFGKWCPEKHKFGIFEEIMLPFDVAEALSEIIKQHMKKLEELQFIEKIEKTVPEKEIKKR